jgi:hypothetical protein
LPSAAACQTRPVRRPACAGFSARAQLQTLELDHNQLTTLPPEWADAGSSLRTNLQLLLADHNNFTGGCGRLGRRALGGLYAALLQRPGCSATPALQHLAKHISDRGLLSWRCCPCMSTVN